MQNSSVFSPHDTFVPSTKQNLLVVSTGLSPNSIFYCLFLLFLSRITNWEQNYQISAEHFHFKDNRH